MNQTLEGFLDQGCQVSLLAMNTSRHFVEENDLPPLYGKLAHFSSVFVNTAINPFSAFFNLFTDKSYNVDRFVNKHYEKALVDLLQRETFDVIQFESIYTSPYLETVRRHSAALCTCRVHNIEHLIWQRLAEHESNFLKRRYLRLLTGRLKAYEMEVLKKFDLLLPISPREQAFFTEAQINRCHYLPFGVSEPLPDAVVPDDPMTCYHIGSMDWAPNVEGVEWFLEEVWKKAAEKLPGVSFCIAGKSMPAKFLSLQEPQVQVVGEVNDFIAFCRQKNIMVVPLLSGAGIRVKILEAMELGKTVISTPVGAEGLGAEHGKEILIAETAEDFVYWLERCFREPETVVRIGAAAREFVSSHFRRSVIYRGVLEAYQKLTASP